MRIGIIMGGISSEKEVSLNTGKSILKYIDRNKYEIIPIIIEKMSDISDVVDDIKELDFALLALHGKFGEDGIIQGFLETLGIPYSGSGILSSALCINKDITKILLKNAEIPTADWINVKSIKEVNYEKLEKIGYPFFVKPNSGGSSVATFKVTKKEDIEKAIFEVLKWDNEVMIEKFIEGREITCPVFENELFPIISIESKTDFYDYNQKYSKNGAKHNIIHFNPEEYDCIKRNALKAFEILRCSVYARVDMILSEDGIPYVLEVNTLPGMTSTSLFPQSAIEKGISYSKFIDKIIESSLKKQKI